MTPKEKFRAGDIPDLPGIYIYRDITDKVIYVGKAVSLRKRMSHYFHPLKSLSSDPKLRSLINSIYSWEYRTVKNESEALLLESTLIKKYAPYYNILMRDDKRYFLVKLDMNEEFPRLALTRLRKNDGARYFGPFPRGSALKQSVEFLLIYFHLRLCPIRNPNEKDRKYCMEGRVKRCSEPCIGKISKEDYLKNLESLIKVLDGSVEEIVTALEQEMQKHSVKMDFEKAALKRDMISNIRDIFGKKGRNFRFASLTKRISSESVDELQKALGISKRPNQIIAFDISNLSDQFAVAGMVCFINGEPAKHKYKRFKIKTVEGINDFAMMSEVVGRYFTRLIEEKHELPDLMIVDGGKGQLSSAIKILTELNISPFPVIGLAKRNEEIFLPGVEYPIILERNNIALQLLQSVRDEVHRFAITYNRELRLKKINESILDDITGIGKERKTALLKSFSSIAELKKSSPEEIVKKTENIGIKMAESIHEYLNRKKKS